MAVRTESTGSVIYIHIYNCSRFIKFNWLDVAFALMDRPCAHGGHHKYMYARIHTSGVSPLFWCMVCVARHQVG